VLFFKDIEGDQLELVGGKALNLGVLAKAGIDGPDGFCVTSAVYKAFIAQNSLAGFLAETTDGEVIRDGLLACPPPDGLEAAVAAALAQFDPETCFAVRSSATAEDLPYASFAGQQDTFLNVVGLADILFAVQACWASLYTDRALAYREKQGIDSAQVSMAVVVQAMVMAETSGIMFTADPVSENRQVIAIEAGFGLGEAMVSGIITPDSYHYDKVTGRITSKTIAHKKLAILPADGGGTVKVALDEVRGSAPVLDDATIIRLVELGERIEELYQSPQDIEWCIANGQINIVQTRAITSLFPLLEPACKDGKFHPHLSLGHGQMMLAPLSPMGIDILRLVFRLSKVSYDDYRPVFLRQAAGRIYIDLSGALQYPPMRRPLTNLLSNLDLLASRACQAEVERPDFGKRIAKTHGVFGDFFRAAHTVPPKVVRRILRADTDQTVAKIEAVVQAKIAAASSAIGQARSLPELSRAIYANIDGFKHIIQHAAPLVAPGLISMKRLEAAEEKLLGTNIYAQEALKGLEGKVATEMGLLTGDLADFVRKSPALRREFEDRDYATFLARIADLPGEAEFKTLLAQFLDRYGVRVAGEIDIALERWSENPEPLVNAVLSMVDGRAEGQHRAEFAATKRTAVAACETFVAEVERRHGKAKASRVAKLVKMTRDCLPAREHPKFMMMHFFYAAKRALLVEADRLVSQGRIDDRRDIFWLGLRELDQAVARGDDLKEVIERRKADYVRYRELAPPRMLTGDGEILKVPYAAKDLPAGALVGVGVSTGVVEGRAKVIFDPTSANLEKGEILVAPYTDPGWTTLFINAAGLVTEIGGLLTHGTVVAREYGIPAVVGCETATTQIQTGDWIQVDGSNGFVIVKQD
jgi:pyruvate,water dikinase